MSKSLKVKIVAKGKSPRSIDFEPNIGDEIYNNVDGLQKVRRKVFDEETNDTVIYSVSSTDPYPEP
ncbi:hypothetical protein KHP07_04100 [Pseudomonas sp. VS40]|uniref:hypothetical protein n=1 Tax=unclassified Pseudomonas TaxID=196821 RepID=UPI001BDF5633|nr:MULTISPECIES: hypothetical protein [unclassified Pseudomonas]MBT1259535.1 hypothetical protein [Pseudomonas sp. VS40]MBT1270829.1 hypothetical protein [Pseudomonas sp. VS59]